MIKERFNGYLDYLIYGLYGFIMVLFFRLQQNMPPFYFLCLLILLWSIVLFLYKVENHIVSPQWLMPIIPVTSLKLTQPVSEHFLTNESDISDFQAHIFYENQIQQIRLFGRGDGAWWIHCTCKDRGRNVKTTLNFPRNPKEQRRWTHKKSTIALRGYIEAMVAELAKNDMQITDYLSGWDDGAVADDEQDENTNSVEATNDEKMGDDQMDDDADQDNENL